MRRCCDGQVHRPRPVAGAVRTPSVSPIGVRLTGTHAQRNMFGHRSDQIVVLRASARPWRPNCCTKRPDDRWSTLEPASSRAFAQYFRSTRTSACCVAKPNPFRSPILRWGRGIQPPDRAPRSDSFPRCRGRRTQSRNAEWRCPRRALVSMGRCEWCQVQPRAARRQSHMTRQPVRPFRRPERGSASDTFGSAAEPMRIVRSAQ